MASPVALAAQELLLLLACHVLVPNAYTSAPCACCRACAALMTHSLLRPAHQMDGFKQLSIECSKRVLALPELMMEKNVRKRAVNRSMDSDKALKA